MTLPEDSPLAGLRIDKVAHSRRPQVDYDALGFGDHYSDHMLVMSHAGGAWGDAEIVPFGPVPVHPANASLHYGQAVFEGLKAYAGVDGAVRLFRAERNAERLRRSCERLCIPPLPEGVFEAAVAALAALERDWVPPRRGEALYLRPLIISDEGHLEVRPSRRFRFLVFASPVRAYFEGDLAAISLRAEERYTRSAPGGIGAAKTAGNYAASLYPTSAALAEGYQQVLWLDGVEHRYVEEVGAMNIFFRFHDRVVTPPLAGTILSGVTRDSVLTLLADAGETVDERPIAIDEVTAAARSGDLVECFGAGTAAIIAPVGRIAHGEADYAVANGQAGELTRRLHEELTGIQHGVVADRHGWCTTV